MNGQGRHSRHSKSSHQFLFFSFPSEFLAKVLFVCLDAACMYCELSFRLGFVFFLMTDVAETAEGAKINKQRLLLLLSTLPRHKVLENQSCQPSTPLETGSAQR